MKVVLPPSPEAPLEARTSLKRAGHVFHLKKFTSREFGAGGPPK